MRLEVDKANPPGAEFTRRLVRLPVPFWVGTLSEPSLFAGKLHALLARAYLDRVKGRDFYDYLFHASRDTPVNMAYLEAKLRDSGHYDAPAPLSIDGLVAPLTERFDQVDFDKAKDDVRPFIKGNKVRSLDDWEPELFIAMAASLKPA